jgi:hypothetical protein
VVVDVARDVFIGCALSSLPVNHDSWFTYCVVGNLVIERKSWSCFNFGQHGATVAHPPTIGRRRVVCNGDAEFPLEEDLSSNLSAARLFLMEVCARDVSYCN